jgi:preprotein translocase subunit SecA
MLKGLINRVFGTRHEREQKRVKPIIDEIIAIESASRRCPTTRLQAQTAKFRGLLAERTGAIEAQDRRTEGRQAHGGRCRGA